MHIRVTERELRRDNQESVALKEGGGGFLGWMGVFHELHCVVRFLFLSSFTLFASSMICGMVFSDRGGCEILKGLINMRKTLC